MSEPRPSRYLPKTVYAGRSGGRAISLPHPGVEFTLDGSKRANCEQGLAPESVDASSADATGGGGRTGLGSQSVLEIYSDRGARAKYVDEQAPDEGERHAE